MSATATGTASQTLLQLVEPVAARIRRVRRERQMTWRAVARAAGLRPGTVRQLERGERTVAAAVVGRIARALGVDEEELYPGGRPDVFWARVGAEMRLAPVAAVVPLRVALPLAA